MIHQLLIICGVSTVLVEFAHQPHRSFEMFIADADQNIYGLKTVIYD